MPMAMTIHLRYTENPIIPGHTKFSVNSNDLFKYMFDGVPNINLFDNVSTKMELQRLPERICTVHTFEITVNGLQDD